MGQTVSQARPRPPQETSQTMVWDVWEATFEHFRASPRPVWETSQTVETASFQGTGKPVGPSVWERPWKRPFPRFPGRVPDHQSGAPDWLTCDVCVIEGSEEKSAIAPIVLLPTRLCLEAMPMMSLMVALSRACSKGPARRLRRIRQKAWATVISSPQSRDGRLTIVLEGLADVV